MCFISPCTASKALLALIEVHGLLRQIFFSSEEKGSELSKVLQVTYMYKSPVAQSMSYVCWDMLTFAGTCFEQLDNDLSAYQQNFINDVIHYSVNL